MSAPQSSVPRLISHDPRSLSHHLWQGTSIAVWFNLATSGAGVQFGEGLQEVSKSHPEGFSSVHLIVDGSAMPNAKVRAEYATTMGRFGPSVACVAMLLEGGGFWAGATRAMITGLQLIEPRSFPMRTFDELTEIADWLPTEHFKRTRKRINSSQLLAAIVHARAHRP